MIMDLCRIIDLVLNGLFPSFFIKTFFFSLSLSFLYEHLAVFISEFLFFFFGRNNYVNRKFACTMCRKRAGADSRHLKKTRGKRRGSTLFVDVIIIILDSSDEQLNIKIIFFGVFWRQSK